MKYKGKKYRGQILVVVVLVLLLLSIMVISIVAVVTRDVEQSLSMHEYEISYNTTEEKMLRILDTYGDVDVPLIGLLEMEGCSLAGQQYICSYQEDNLETEVTVEDTNEVENFELGKDETFKVILNNYRGKLKINWSANMALVMSLEYTDVSSEYKVLKDVHDEAGVFTMSGSGPQDHPLAFTVPAGEPQTIEIDLNTVPGIALSDSLTYLKVKAAMKGDNISTLLSINGDASLPSQVRKVEGYTYYSSLGAPSSAPIVITQVPLAGKSPEILNYVFYSDNVVTK